MRAPPRYINTIKPRPWRLSSLFKVVARQQQQQQQQLLPQLALVVWRGREFICLSGWPARCCRAYESPASRLATFWGPNVAQAGGKCAPLAFGNEHDQQTVLARVSTGHLRAEAGQAREQAQLQTSAIQLSSLSLQGLTAGQVFQFA